MSHTNFFSRRMDFTVSRLQNFDILFPLSFQQPPVRFRRRIADVSKLETPVHQLSATRFPTAHPHSMALV